MKAHKKLAENISDSIRDKLGETDGRPEKLRKLVKRMAKKLAEKVVRISLKQDKRLKKGKQSPQPFIQAKMPKKQKIKTGLKGVDTTERELLLIEKTGRATKKK